MLVHQGPPTMLRQDGNRMVIGAVKSITLDGVPAPEKPGFVTVRVRGPPSP